MRPLGAPYGPLERTSTTLVVVSPRLGAHPGWGLGRGSAAQWPSPDCRALEALRSYASLAEPRAQPLGPFMFY